MRAGLIGLVMSGALALAACSNPPNVVSSGGGKFRPAAGYVWASTSDTSSLAVVWKPGSAHGAIANVVAALSEKQWVPADGYEWVNPESVEAGVRWLPGIAHTQYPHVFSSSTEGSWSLEEGYRWTNHNVTLDTAWSPGRAHTRFANVKAALEEGRWSSDPGYAWSTPGQLSPVVWTENMSHPLHPNIRSASLEGRWRAQPGYVFASEQRLDVYWSPGSRHPNQYNLIASNTEGRWTPASGYAFVSSDPADLRIMASHSGSGSGDKFWNFVAAVGVAVVANHYAQPQEGDGMLANGLGRPVAGEIRDEALRAAARQLN